MYSYSLILLASIFFPILFSFEKNVFYFSKWLKILKSATFIAIPFLIWDVIFTSNGIWGFNESYTFGIKILKLPIEEILFFILIPFAMFIFWEASLKFNYYKFFKNYNFFYIITSIVVLFFLLIFWDKSYTLWVSLSVLLTNFILVKQKKYIKQNVIFLFFISVPFFLVVNGFLTAIPIVWYDYAEKSNIMIGSIPIEDLFYSYALLSLNAIYYEKNKSK